MTWTNSKVFGVMLYNSISNQTNNIVLGTDAFKVALYGTNSTPDNTVSTANSSYASGQWISSSNGTNEVWSTQTASAGWPQTGLALASPTFTTASSGSVPTAAYTATFNGNSLSSTTSTAIIAAAYGCLVYDTTQSGNPGVCYNYFGGSQSVTNGTFTIVWNASGIAQFQSPA